MASSTEQLKAAEAASAKMAANATSLDSLQRDMLQALDFDQKKTQLNDAKLRAVAQKVEYDDFEKLVKGAHLKPLKPRSQQSADISKQFDGFVMGKYESGSAQKPGATSSAAASSEPRKAPATAPEFLRVWRRQCKTAAEKCAYLRLLEPELLPALFRTELEPAVFDGIVGAMCTRLAEPTEEAAAADEVAWVEQMLAHIARINRFELTLDFADKSTTKSLPSIFGTLEAEAAEAKGRLERDALAALKAKYQVK